MSPCVPTQTAFSFILTDILFVDSWSDIKMFSSLYLRSKEVKMLFLKTTIDARDSSKWFSKEVKVRSVQKKKKTHKSSNIFQFDWLVNKNVT